MILKGVIAILSLSSLAAAYRSKPDDRSLTPSSRLLDEAEVDVNINHEKAEFSALGICAAEDGGGDIATCSSSDPIHVSDIIKLRKLSCYCDDRCREYDDCCIDKLGFPVDNRRQWSCHEVRGTFPFWIYVIQQCPPQWEDETIRNLCQTEASVLRNNGEDYDYLQDIPVLSNATGVFYRNVFCALCNVDAQLQSWDTKVYCLGNTTSMVDLNNAIYDPTRQHFRVKIDGRLRICKILIKQFQTKTFLTELGARLCKPVVNTCQKHADLTEKCNSFTSYVYKNISIGKRRPTYKNFYCALCNDIPISNLVCMDPYRPLLYNNPNFDEVNLAITAIFNFSFRGGNNEIGPQCYLSRGQVWDPLLKRCLNVTCGALYKKVGLDCVPLENATTFGIKSDCKKVILEEGMFQVTLNGSVYVNHTGKLYSREAYEIYEKQEGTVVKVLVCFDERYLLPYSKAHQWLSEITVSISVICLILHLTVYALLPKLRNCPGKVLMSLSSSLLCGHFALLIGGHFTDIRWLCYTTAVVIHSGYLSAFMWMNVMAFDIYRTFSVTQARNSYRRRTFAKYCVYSFSCTLIIVLLAIIVDNSLPAQNEYKPRFGDPLCWFNQRKSMLLFFTVPVATVLFSNIIFFVVTAVHIRKMSRDTKMVNSFSEKMRYFLYIKLSIVFGLTWTLGFLAALSEMDAFWYPFIILNGLQGALIFLMFTIKKSIFDMLVVNLKLRSHTYKLGKVSGLKKAMYSSLSNLSTLQTTLTSKIVLPKTENSQEMLKAVRRINSDL